VETPFEVAEEKGQDGPLLSVRGEIDIMTAPTLLEHLKACIGPEQWHGTVDLREVGFLDSTGLGVLVTTQKRCQDNGGGLRLVINSERILRVFEITGLTEHFEIVESIVS
jgi:anti-sigma B factor antagonist